MRKVPGFPISEWQGGGWNNDSPHEGPVDCRLTRSQKKRLQERGGGGEGKIPSRTLNSYRRLQSPIWCKVATERLREKGGEGGHIQEEGKIRGHKIQDILRRSVVRQRPRNAKKAAIQQGGMATGQKDK